MTKNTSHTMSQKKYPFRKLEDLNLIDNFLFQQMLSQKNDGELFAKILLSTILGKPIKKVRIMPQKNILSTDTDRHGIRLDAYIEDISGLNENAPIEAAATISDIYDIEPNNSYERETLPRRMRYYHGLIDSGLLSAGSGYENLPCVIIIVILPYDPFGQNRMVYTIKNHCEEVPEIPYDDGARKIFLNTKGTKGNPSQALRDMLKYIEKSTSDNVTNEDIATIQQLVNKVKHKKEVGINYMKSWEVEKMIHEDAFNEGFHNGFNDGFNNGFNDGFNDGSNEAITKMNRLILTLTEQGRVNDLTKSATDSTYREQLMQELNIT